jgi:hypothetical protein
MYQAGGTSLGNENAIDLPAMRSLLLRRSSGRNGTSLIKWMEIDWLDKQKLIPCKYTILSDNITMLY